MAYTILDNRNDKDLEKGLFASIPAIQGEQFGREVYSTVVQFKDLSSFLEIFPEVQRDINPRKVASIRKYILTADESSLRFFSSITVTCRGHAFYDATNKRLAIDVHNSKLSVNDGQHRFEGIRSTLEYLENEFLKSKDSAQGEKIRLKINSLENMVIPMIIFSGLTESQEKHLFHDINNLAQRPSKNTNIKLNQSDLLSKLAREVSEYNRYLKHYGVETEKVSIHDNNPNTILLTTIYNSIKELLKPEGHGYLTESNYKEVFKEVNAWFDEIFFALPHDINVKGKYVIDKSYCLPSMFRFIAKMRKENLGHDFIINTIATTDFSVSNVQWAEYDGRINAKGRIEFPGGGHGGSRAVYRILMDSAKDSLSLTSNLLNCSE